MYIISLITYFSKYLLYHYSIFYIMSDMELKRVGIVSNQIKDKDLKGALKAAEILRLKGARVFFDTNGMPAGEKEAIDFSQIDCLFVLGGDGTLLKAALMASRFDVSILGINLGRLGFLTEIELHHIEKAIDEMIAGNFYFERRIMLDCSVYLHKKAIFQIDALNDIAVLKKDIARTINIKLSINGAMANDVDGDGMLISTPTGSTGYSLSAGGPIIDPKLDCLLATPVCPHSLSSRTLVISGSDEISITPTSPNGSVLVSDGNMQREINNGETVKIKKSAHQASFIRFHENYFYPLMRSKLSNWNR